jgi:hypothetical protein
MLSANSSLGGYSWSLRILAAGHGTGCGIVEIPPAAGLLRQLLKDSGCNEIVQSSRECSVKRLIPMDGLLQHDHIALGEHDL